MNIELKPLEEFYKNKRVLITGHSGFKGGWLSFWLHKLGAKVYGYSLYPPFSDLNASLYRSIQINTYDMTKDLLGDIRDYDKLSDFCLDFRPEIVFHLAAQPIVSEGYADPRYTFETNVMGTVNVLESIRDCRSVESAAIITTDKVYDESKLNRETGYKETDELNGHDPYANSKSCADLATQCYINCYMNEYKIPVSIFRAGNVIGGGDFAKNRIVPDFIKAWTNNDKLTLRNPYSVRPYQHVLEPLYIYLTIAMNQAIDSKWQGIYNIGPNAENCVCTETLIQSLDKYFNNNQANYIYQPIDMKESPFLILDCSRLKSLGWQSIWDIDTTAKAIYDWYNIWHNEPNNLHLLRGCMEKQIDKYCKEIRK